LNSLGWFSYSSGESWYFPAGVYLPRPGCSRTRLERSPTLGPFEKRLRPEALRLRLSAGLPPSALFQQRIFYAKITRLVYQGIPDFCIFIFPCVYKQEGNFP
jgi:hypothetical protein